MIFESATNKNITFNSINGRINVNGEDLGHLVVLAKRAHLDLNRINSAGVDLLQSDVRSLETRVTNLEQSRSSGATVLDDIKTKVNTILGTGGSNPLTPRQVRRAIRKVNRIEEQLNRLNTVSDLILPRSTSIMY